MTSHSSVLPREVSLATRLTRNIQLNLPLVSALMLIQSEVVPSA